MKNGLLTRNFILIGWQTKVVCQPLIKSKNYFLILYSLQSYFIISKTINIESTKSNNLLPSIPRLMVYPNNAAIAWVTSRTAGISDVQKDFFLIFFIHLFIFIFFLPFYQKHLVDTWQLLDWRNGTPRPISEICHIDLEQIVIW